MIQAAMQRRRQPSNEQSSTSVRDLLRWLCKASFDGMFRQAREDPWQQLLPVDHLNSYLLQTKSGSHAEILTVHVRRNVSNIGEARRANLHVKSNIQHLVLSWEKQ